MLPCDYFAASLPCFPREAFFAILTDLLPRFVIGEIRVFVLDTFGHCCACGFVSIKDKLMVTLRFGQRFFFRAKEALIGNLDAIRAGGKRLQPHINADLMACWWQCRRFPLTGKGDKPLVGARAFDRGRLRRARQRTVINGFDITDL